jgi:hypothetical protein
MSGSRVAIELSREDWERICRGLDERWQSEEAAVEELEGKEEAYGEDWGEEINACRAEQAAALRLFDLVRQQAGVVVSAEREAIHGLSGEESVAS